MTFQITSPEDHFNRLNDSINFLEAQGYTVLLLEQWMPLVEYRRQLGMKPNTICERLRRSGCPPFEARRGATGRISEIKPNDALTAFLLDYKPRKHAKPKNRS